MKKLSLLFVSMALFLVLGFSSVNAADVVEDTGDGGSITTKDDGTIITKYSDGTIETVKPDGSSKTVNPDGSTSTVSAEGEVTETPPTLKSADEIGDIFDAVTNEDTTPKTNTTLGDKKIIFTKPPEENKSTTQSTQNNSSSTKTVSNVVMKKLPQTGPAEIILILFSFILAGIILYKRK